MIGRIGLNSPSQGTSPVNEVPDFCIDLASLTYFSLYLEPDLICI